MQHFSSLSVPHVLILCVFFTLSACQQKNEASFAGSEPPPPPRQAESNEQQLDRAPAAAAPTTEGFQDVAANGDLFSSAAAVPGAIDSIKQFVRNAEIRFRVQTTTAAALRIEQIAQSNGGFVVSSNLNSAIELRHIAPISRDSALETTRYTMQCQLVIRVPYQQLDTTLRSIGKLSEFLDMRHIDAEDVGIQMLEQRLTRLREGFYQTELSLAAENKLHPKADRARDSRLASDQAQIETLKLEDKIRFSTVRIDLYQAPQIRHTMVANTEIDFAQASFAARLGTALDDGAKVLLLLLFGVIRLWGVILIIVAGYFGWKWLQVRRKWAIFAAKKSV